MSITFSGFIEEIDGVSVDCFVDENTRRSTAFFLSHCHADHMVGLNGISFSSHISSKTDQFLYCSEVTARLLKNMIKGNESVLNKIKPLALGPNWLQVPIKDSDYLTDVVVTLLPAGHCLGSCMFLFETNDYKVLYTGDFRFNACDLPKMAHLHDRNKKVKPLDSIYLDTTFWNQANNHFPTRHQSLEMIIERIDEFMRETANLGHVHIDRPARIGSEFIITKLNQKYGKKIHASKDSMAIYDGIEEVISCLTTDIQVDETFLHMCQSYNPGQQRRVLPCVKQYVNVLHIRPTAQWFSVGEEFYPVRGEKSVIQISNSMHASRSELIEFIKYFKPMKVVACVVPKKSSLEKIQKEIDAVLDSCRCENLS